MTTAIYDTLNTISSSANYNNWIFRQLKGHLSGDVLDIGSGLGDIVTHYSQQMPTSVTATDYSSEMIPHLEQRFQHLQNYKVRQLDISCAKSLQNFADESIDTITSVNVLEHIEDDRRALMHMHRLLKKGGKLILLVPAFPFLYGSLDALVSHFRRYTKKTLQSALEDSRFSVKKQYYMNMLGVVTWYISGRILKHSEFKKGTCSKLDKIVPYLERMESLAPPPFGQSLVSISTKE